MRIIGGTHRGTALAAVGKGDAGAQLRPTTDRVRESLFNVLMGHGMPEQGARVLDLFAGTGALGLEALSRGAGFVTFVDDGRVAQRLIRENIAKLRRQNECKLVTANATRLGPCEDPHDLIFLDPPYGKNLGAKALDVAMAKGWIAQDAFVVWEESTPQEAPDGFDLLDCRKYGDTHITLLERA